MYTYYQTNIFKVLCVFAYDTCTAGVDMSAVWQVAHGWAGTGFYTAVNPFSVDGPFFMQVKPTARSSLRRPDST